MQGPAFVSVKAGSLVETKGRTFKITHQLGLDSVLAQDVETNGLERLYIADLKPASPPAPQGDKKAVASGRDLEAVPDEEWKEAQRRFDIIRPLIEDRYRTRAKAEQRALDAGVHVATIYDWLRLYGGSGQLSALIPQKRGRRPGSKKLTEQTEAVVESVIQSHYLVGQRFRPQAVVDEVLRQCRVANITPPHPNTVRNRLRHLPAAMVLRRRGFRDKARDDFEPIRGTFPGADYPLAVVQIDHTEADIIVVEEHTRLPMGRPWVTLAIDVFSRMVVGCYISMERPGAAATGLCLSRAMLPKNEYLAALDIPGDWPVWGKMSAVHADNAKEFRGAMLERACRQYGIDPEFRPVKRPHYGGHIERLMGTSANEIRKLPGTTFSSPSARKGYDSERQSALTLDEFERRLMDFIVNVYHRRIHSELNMPPCRQWEIGILGDSQRAGIGLPEIPGDPDRLRLDFMPFITRTVQDYGIVIDEVFYYHEVLNPWINAKDPEAPKTKREFIVRRDPRDISRVFFYDPEAEQYFAIPYRDISRPPISLWELRAARQRLKEEGRRHVDENAIFEAVERMRQLVEQSVTKTKAARRQHHRTKAVEKVTKDRRVNPSVSPLPPEADQRVIATPSTSPSLFDLEDDIFSEPIQPFDDLGGAK